MNRTVKIFLFGLGGFGALLLAAVVLIPLFVDVNDFKEEIASQVRQHTGRELVFEGDISLHVFPRVVLELGPLRMADDPAFGEGDFARIKGAACAVELLPMFSGEFRVGVLRLDGLELNLVQDKDGWGNWQSLMGERKPGASKGGAPAGEEKFALAAPEKKAGSGVQEKTLTEDAPPPPASMRDAEQPAAAPRVSVQTVSITDAAVRFADRATGASYALTGFSLDSGALALDDTARFTDLTLRCAVALAEPKIDAAITAKARANLDSGAGRLEIRDLDLAVAATGGAVPGGKADLAATGALAYDLGSGALSLDGVRVTAYGAALRATLAVNAASSVEGRIELEPTDLRAVLAAAGMAAPAMADPKALTSVAAALDLKASAGQVDLPAIAVSLDGASLAGSASAGEFDKPRITFALTAPAVDADRYMPAQKARGSDDKKDDKAGDVKDVNEDDKQGNGKMDDAVRSALRRLVLDGSLSVGRLKAAGVVATDVAMTVTARDGVLKVSPLRLDLYGGTVKTTVTADLRGKTAATSMGLAVSGVGVSDLVRDMTGQDLLSGAASLALNLKGEGEAWQTLVHTLQGDGSFKLLDGAFNGIQIVPEGTGAQLHSEAQRKTLEKVEKRQPFKAITAAFSVKKGVVSTNTLKLSADKLSATGGGSVDLPANTLDFSATVDIAGLPKLPIHASGSLADPSYGLDTAAFLKEAVSGIANVPVKAGEALLQGVGEALGVTNDKKSGTEDGKETKSNGNLLESIGNIFGGSKQ